MKLLVLGKTGQLGAELVERAPALGAAVKGLGREDLDVTDPDAVAAVLDVAGPEVVVNTTAYHVVPDCDRFPDRAFAANATAVKTLAEACQQRGIEFVTFSTDYVFDGLKGAPYFEEDPPNPLQTYGVSKLAGELLSRIIHPDAIVIRTCGVYGGETGSRSKKGNIVLSILRESEAKTELEVSSEQIVNPTYAGDLAAATLGLLAARPAGGMYHLAAEGHCSWAEFAAAIMDLSGRRMRIVPVDHGGRSGTMRRPRFSALANRRARLAGVTLPDWKDGLGRYLQRLAVTARR
jgi:dTDP-4-dehydrorhamnose reductase